MLESQNHPKSETQTLIWKMTWAWDLTRRQGLTVFFSILALALLLALTAFVLLNLLGFWSLVKPVLTNAQTWEEIDFSAYSVTKLFSLLLCAIILGWLGQLFSIGLLTLILQSVDDYHPPSVLVVLFSVFSRLPVLLPIITVWFFILTGLNIAVGLASLIPGLGSLINLAGLLFFLILAYCLNFYLAENDRPTLIEAMSHPFRLVFIDLLLWLAPLGLLLLLWLPPGLILGLVAGAAAADGSSFFSALLFFTWVIYYLIVTIYFLFLVAITYRQAESRLTAGKVGV